MTRSLDLGPRAVGALPLAPCGRTTDHAPHRHTASFGDLACAGTVEPCDLRQVWDGGEWTARWVVGPQYRAAA